MIKLKNKEKKQETTTEKTKKKTEKKKNKPQKKDNKKRNKENVISLLKDANNKKTIKLIFNELIGFLKKLKPKKFYSKIDFSTGEPDLTGYTTAALAVIPFVNTKESNIHPDFMSDDPYIMGKIRIKGGIKPIQLVVVLFRLLKDKGFRRFLQKIR